MTATALEFFQYATTPDGVVVTGATQDAPSDLVVPSTFGDRAVVAIGPGAFKERGDLTSITLPDGLKKIDEFAFASCSNLTSIRLPSSCETIGRYAFFGCVALRAITFPAALLDLDPSALYKCVALESIETQEGARRYVAIAGALYDGGTEGLVAYPPAKKAETLVVPKGVRAIGFLALDGIDPQTSVILQEGVESVDMWAFGPCAAIVLPQSVQVIAPEAFDSKTLLFVKDGSFALEHAKKNGLAHRIYGELDEILQRR